MANHPSAEKRNRQRIARTAANRSQLSATRTTVKKARVALTENNVEAAKEAVQAASVALARASSKGRMHPKTAARVTSRIQAQLHKQSQG